jgi:hypothetical protein
VVPGSLLAVSHQSRQSSAIDACRFIVFYSCFIHSNKKFKNVIVSDSRWAGANQNDWRSPKNMKSQNSSSRF